MELDLLRIDRGKRGVFKDAVAEEIPLTLHFNEEEMLTLLCSPAGLKELTAGFFYSAGLIDAKSGIEKISIDTKNHASYMLTRNKDIKPLAMFKRMYTSGCGRGAYFYSATHPVHKKKLPPHRKMPAQRITGLMQEFQMASRGFKETGCMHSAALCDAEKIILFSEDIGRHNAVDKVIGDALLKGIDMRGAALLSSGRLSSEIVLKAEKAGFAFLISRSAPTDQAVKLAEELNLTLVGFVRGGRMNVYAAGERISEDG